MNSAAHNPALFIWLEMSSCSFRTLRGPRLYGGHDPALEHPRPKPTPDQLQHPSMVYPPLDLSDQSIPVDFAM